MAAAGLGLRGISDGSDGHFPGDKSCHGCWDLVDVGRGELAGGHVYEDRKQLFLLQRDPWLWSFLQTEGTHHMCSPAW